MMDGGAAEGLPPLPAAPWMGAVSVYADDTGAAVEKCELLWGAGGQGVFEWAVQKVFLYSAAWFEERVGVAPTAKKLHLREKHAAIAALKAEVASAMQELAKSFCLKTFDADASYYPPPVRMGYLLKYGLYNACIAAAILLRHAPIVVPPGLAKLHVATFGGGPATDYLAVKTMALQLGVGLRVRVYDLPHWEGFWQGGGNIGEEDAAVFCSADILTEGMLADPLRDGKAEEDGPDGRFCGSDPCLVTLFYTANEMANSDGSRDHFVKFVRALARRVPPGSRIVLLDRTRQAVTSLLARVAEELRNELDTVVLSRRVEPVLPVQMINLVADYTARFGVKPRMAGKAGLTVYTVRPHER